MNSEMDKVEMQGEAERWFLRVQEPGATGAERLAADRWRAAHPGHEAAWRQVEAIWGATAELAGDPAIAEALREAERPAPRAPRRWRSWPGTGGLLAALAVVVAVAPPWSWSDRMFGVRHATALGEQRTVTLADGSIAILDTATVLRERNSDDLRRIDLEHGQADFQVRQDPARPFVVHVAGGTVTALGTRFQVRLEDTAAAITLLEGSVQVAPPDSRRTRHAPATLVPGQRLRFDATRDDWATDTVDLEAARGWAEGQLRARNWRLADLLAEMNRYVTTPLRLGDPALADLPISGTFHVGDQASLVLTLERGWSLRARPTADGGLVLDPAKPGAK